MKIKEVFCKRWFLKRWVAAITLYPFIFYNTYHKMYKEDFLTLQKHEMVHVEQVERDGFFKFYLTYFWDSVVRRVPYLENKYEVEAYKRQNEK